MGKIVSKLSLNKTPQAIENNSFVFAKNIRVLKDGTIGPDTSYDKIDSGSYADNKYFVGKIVGVNNKVYFFYRETIDDEEVVNIYEYNELSGDKRKIECGWKYSGGTIDGKVTINNTNEEILTICEYFEDGSELNVPIKHINLTQCKATDDESIYTQAPNIPLTNLTVEGYYSKTIPNGVYQFFVRYKIREDFYTLWYPCSKECFAGTSKVLDTIQGQLRYVDTTRDSSESFILHVDHVFEQHKKNYIDFQIGFILSHDDAVIARSWKNFSFDTTNVYFDYEESVIEEIDIDEILTTNYELFNVKNIAYFKNKLYIANYKETNFNPRLQNEAKNITITLEKEELDDNDTILIGDNKLIKSNSSLGYYDLWGGKYISDLFISDQLNNTDKTKNTKTDVTTTGGKISKLTAYWKDASDLEEKPKGDIYWINKNEASVKVNNNNIIPEFDYGTDWNDVQGTDIFDLDTGAKNYIKNNRTHAIETLYPFNNKFYWRCGSNNFNAPNGTNFTGRFRVFPYGLREPDKADDIWRSALKSTLDEQYPKAVICNIFVSVSASKIIYLYGTDSNYTDYDDASFDINGEYITDVNNIKNKAFDLVKSKIKGVDSVGNYYIEYDDEGTTKISPIVNWGVSYAEFEYKIEEKISADSSTRTKTFESDVTVKRTQLTWSVKVNSNYIKTDSSVNTKLTTLMPFTDYEFYIHYVKENGIATNGYYIDTKRKDDYAQNSGIAVIYPNISNVSIPEGYSSYFISICKVNNDACRCFNYRNKNGVNYLDCLDLDSQVYNCITNLHINKAYLENGELKYKEITHEAKYNPSGTTDPINLFGNCGCISWSGETYNDVDIVDTINVKTKINPAGVQHSSTFGSYLIIYANYLNPTNITETFDMFFVVDDFEDFDTTQPVSELITYLEDTLETKLSGTGITANVSQGIIGDPNVYITLNSPNNITIEGHAINKLAITYFPGIYYTQQNIKAAQDYTKSLAKTAKRYSTDSYWLVIYSEQGKNKNKKLTKLTPYLKEASYSNYTNMNMPGYITAIQKLDYNVANTLYVSGTDVYNYDSISETGTNNLENIDAPVAHMPSPIYYIPSNFNLNYVTLNDSSDIDGTPQIRSYIGENDENCKQVVNLIQTLTSSYILKLPQMYKNYTRKYYDVYDETKIDVFDNTIRSSDVNVDERYRNIYRFYAEDIYNIPTNRGIITNLFNIINKVYVHTEHSLFEFAGMNSLTSEEGQISLKETDTFETGVKELFDSANGHAGLQDKKCSIVTFNAYIFYDKLANTIYAYGGETQMVAISDPIRKILDYYDINTIRFASDESNDRIFINIKIGEENVCLSYNFIVKSFVSIHDFNFAEAFNSRTNLYFTNYEITKTEHSEDPEEDTFKETGFNIFKSNYKEFNKYKELYKKSMFHSMDLTEPSITTSPVESCVDVVCNENYEIIKNLECINWICSKINSYVAEGDVINFAEENNSLYSGHKLRIYTDQCNSNLIPLVDNNGVPLNQNDVKISSTPNPPNAYLNNISYPVYNQGIWSINYFRDISHNTRPESSRLYLQDDSLIYGKYIVVRLILNNNFKLENITFKTNNYGKTN